MLGIFGQILGPVSNLAGTWLQGRVDKAKAETDVKVARARAEAKVYETEATSSMLMEQNLTNQMAGSWKDEAWTIFFAFDVSYDRCLSLKTGTERPSCSKTSTTFWKSS